MHQAEEFERRRYAWESAAQSFMRFYFLAGAPGATPGSDVGRASAPPVGLPTLAGVYPGVTPGFAVGCASAPPVKLPIPAAPDPVPVPLDPFGGVKAEQLANNTANAQEIPQMEIFITVSCD